MQKSNQAKAMLYYELIQLRQNPINLFIVLLVPSIAIILIKLFFDSVMLFGYIDGYSNRINTQYYNFTRLKELNATFIHYYPAEYGEIINNSVVNMINNYQILQREGIINKKAEFNSRDVLNMIHPVYNLTELEMSQLSRAFQQFESSNQTESTFNEIAEQLGFEELSFKTFKQALYDRYNINADELENAQFDSSLYTITFIQAQNGSLMYQIRYNQTLLAQLNLLRNETTWNILNYNQNYQNALGTQLQLYLDNAILAAQGVSTKPVNIYPYPSKQLTLNDSSQMDHGVVCLGLIILFICATHYIARDRGKQQTSLRLLGMKEFPYIVIRFLVATLMVTVSAILMCICGQFSGVLPFKATNIGVNIVSGLLIGSMISGQLIMISSIFAGRGVVGAIVFILVLMLLTNFIIEMVIYIVYSGYSLSDTSLISKTVSLTLSIIFPNINIINLIDSIRYNAIQLTGNDKIGFSIFNTVKQATCTKIIIETEYIPCNYDMISIGATYGILIGQNIVFLALAVIISFIKPETGKPFVNPFKLFSAAQRIKKRQELVYGNLDHFKIIYSRKCKKPLTVVHDFNLNIQDINEQVNQAKIGLLGVSAAGKTSLLSAISGQIVVKKAPHSTGMIMNHNLYNSEERYLIKECISICPQSNENVVQDLTLRQNIYLSGLLNVYQSSKQLNLHINNLLDSFQLLQHQHKKVSQLSGGMQRRLSICNCFISCFQANKQTMRLLILDELSSGQDPYTCRLINTKLNEICENNQNINFILSTHDMKQVTDVCNYMIMMEKGHVKINDTVKNIQLQNDNVPFVKILFKQHQDELYININDAIQFMKQTFDQSQYQVIAKTLQFLKVKLKDKKILPKLYEYLNGRVDQIQIDKGNLSDIFMDNIQKDEDVIGNINNEISKPDVSSKRVKTVRGLYKLYYLQDYQNSYIKIPFVVLFVMLIPTLVGISLLINNAIVKFLDGQVGNLTNAAYGTTFQGCLQCCGFNTEFNATQSLSQQEIIQKLQNCVTNNSCFSSSSNIYYTPGQCFDAIQILGFPVVYDALYKINDIDSHSEYYTGYQNNIYKYDYIIDQNAKPIHLQKNTQSIQSMKSTKDNVNITENQILRLKCYQCADMCNAECSIYLNYDECNTKCQEHIHFDQINERSIYDNSNNVSCENVCLLTNPHPSYEFNQYDDRNSFNLIKNNISKWQNNTQVLTDFILTPGPYLRQQIHEITNTLIPQAMLELKENETNIYGYFPQFRGGFLMYEEYKAKFKTYQLINNTSFSQINYTEQQFDLSYDKLYNISYNFLQRDMKLTQIKYDKFNEIYNSINIGLQPQLFDNINYIINKIHNSYIQLNANVKEIQPVTEIQVESQPYPLFSEKYKSNSFNTYVKILQSLIIQIFLNIPIIHSAIIFTTLKNSQFIDLLNVHGIYEQSIYGHFLLYSILYQVPAILLGSLVGYFVEVPQLMHSPIMFILYSCSICFSNTVMGIIISRLCKDKKQSILICCILIVMVVFISLFSVKSSFLMLLLPQLYAIHSLLYLNNLPLLEEVNFLAPILISLAYFFMIIIPQNPVFEQNLDMHLNNYLFEDSDDIKIQINEQQQQNDNQNNRNIDIQHEYDLFVNNISVCIQNTKILDDIDFKIKRNHSFGLLGLSGSGKSVTLQTLLRQIKQTYGNVFIRNNQTNSMKNIQDYKHNVISYVSQMDILLDSLTMKQHIDILCDVHHYKTRSYVESLIQILQLNPHYKKRINQLSGGTKRRLSFLLALLQCESNVIAFDETSTGLSPDLKIILWSIITMIQQKLQKSYIVTTHYMDEIQAMVQELIILQKGKIMVKTNTNNLMKQQDYYNVVFEKSGDRFMSTQDTIMLLEQEQTTERYYIENQDIQDIFLSIYDNLQTTEYKCI